MEAAHFSPPCGFATIARRSDDRVTLRPSAILASSSAMGLCFTAVSLPRSLASVDCHPLPHMRLVQLARRPPQWLRVALAALLLAFAVNSIAAVTHRHDAAPSSAHHSLACGYCLSFNGLADAPRHDHASLALAPDSFYLVADLEPWFAPRPATSARPRAPPAL
jgi:hypothetical protein